MKKSHRIVLWLAGLALLLKFLSRGQAAGSPGEQVVGTINFLPTPLDPNNRGYDGSGINWQLGQRHY